MACQYTAVVAANRQNSSLANTTLKGCRLDFFDMISLWAPGEFEVVESPLQTNVTYEVQLDTTIQCYSTQGKSTPQQIADMFSKHGNFPLTVSYIKARLKAIQSGGLEVDGDTKGLYPGDVEKAFGGASLPASGTQSRKPVGWNMHVDMYVSEIDVNDAGVREKVQDACGFEPPVDIDWLRERLRVIAPKSLKWVKENAPPNKSLTKRIEQRMAAGGTVPDGSVGQVN